MFIKQVNMYQRLQNTVQGASQPVAVLTGLLLHCARQPFPIARCYLAGAGEPQCVATSAVIAVIGSHRYRLPVFWLLARAAGWLCAAHPADVALANLPDCSRVLLRTSHAG